MRGWGTFLYVVFLYRIELRNWLTVTNLCSFYAIFDIIMATWVFFFVPETKGKSLERVNAEIDHDESKLEQKRLAVEQEQVDDVAVARNAR